MGYRLGKKKIDIQGKRINRISQGKNGDVYKYKGQILLVYPKNFQQAGIIDEPTAKYLTGISTDRILLPREILYYNGKYSGFSYRDIDRKGSNRRIINATKNEFLNNVKLLENDVENLSKRNILLDGITPSNVVYNGELYITNPSKYYLLESIDLDGLEQLNLYQLHLLLSELIISDMRKEDFMNGQINETKELLSLKEEYEKSSEFFSVILEDSQNIKQFLKKM